MKTTEKIVIGIYVTIVTIALTALIVGIINGDVNLMTAFN